MSAAELRAKALELHNRVLATADAEQRLQLSLKALELEAEADAQDDEELADTVKRSARAQSVSPEY
jgi:hypothetical protein